MSDLLNSASLVMIPSGYKEDKVYSVVPSDGSGDLSFTRASNGTRVNSAGLVEVCPWNLMPWSETFNFATGGWALQGGAITVANSGTAPNGTNTATLLYPSINGSIVAPNRRAEPVTTPDTAIYTQYVYAKASGKNFLALYQFNGSSGAAAWFNLSTGVVGTVGSGCTAFIESAGNGWYKCGFSQSVTSGQSLYMHIYPTDADNTNTVTASGTNGILIWGAQLNIGSTAKPYFPTTDRLNVPRLTYQNGGGGCPSLLLEKQSTNKCLYSEQFDNAGWTKYTIGVGASQTITANYGISPDGTQNADRLQLTRGNIAVSGSGLQQTLTETIGATFTLSVWLKSLSGTPTICLGFNTTDFSQNVTLTTEWVRYTYTHTATSTTLEPHLTILGSAYTSGNSLSADFLAWGYQVEASSYPTSYIPTTSSSATRVADACSKTGISSLIGQTEGVIFFDYDRTNSEGSEDIWLSDGTYNNFAYWGNSNKTFHFIVSGFSTKLLSDSSIGIGRYKIAVAYKSGDYVLYVNGVQKATNTTTGVPPMSQIGLSTEQTTPYGQGNPLNQAALFKTRLSNSDLIALTTI